MMKYNTKKVSSVSEFVEAVKDGYAIIYFSKEIKTALFEELNKLKDSNDIFLFAYLIELFEDAYESKTSFLSEEEAINLAKKIKDDDNSRQNFIIGYYYFLNPLFKDSDKKIPFLLSSAEAGFPLAQGVLGDCYYDGNGVEQDYDKAYSLYSSAVKVEYARAQNSLAICYYYGKGVEQDYKKSFELCMLAANQGYRSAMRNVGISYYYGDGVEQSYEKAFEWYLKAANAGNAAAMNNLANCYFYGDGIEKDYEKAFEWYLKAANAENKNAMNSLGNCYYYGDGVEKDYKKAFEWYLKAAELGNEVAMNNLASCYFYGEGVEKDYKKAFKWYLKSSELDYEVAMNNLANCYYNGEGIEKDCKKAFEWYTKAFELGNEHASNNIGNCYYYGNGVEQSYEKAFEWYTKGAELGNKEAICNLGDCYYYGDGTEKNYEKAIELYSKAAELGHHTALCNLGDCYMNGFGVEQNSKKAFELYQESLEKGCQFANYKLGNCYYYGDGVEKDFNKAFELYKKAAEEGFSSAQNSLANCYFYGEGVEKDYEKGFEWCLKAAESDDAYAQANLGVCYYDGNGVEQDYAKAFEWFLKAADNGFVRAKIWIGDLYKDGNGVEQDYAKAFEWYSKAAEDEDEGPAQHSLGSCYEEGIGVKIDYEKALFYYKKAFKCGFAEAQEDIDRVKSILEEKSKLSSVDIFISWNHNDQKIKDDIREELIKNGIKAWETDKDSEGKLDESVANAIKSAKGFIILLSPEAFNSSYMPSEVQLILDKINEDVRLEKAIRVQILKDADNVTKRLKELDDDHPFKKLLPYTMAFGDDVKDIVHFAQRVVASDVIAKYQMQLRDKYSIFPISLSNVILKQANKNIISTLELENGYINRDLIGIDEKRYTPEDLLSLKKNALIVAEGGAGKSLYVKNLLRRFSRDEKVFFYFPCSDLKELIKEKPDITLLGLIEDLFSRITNSERMPSYVADSIFRDDNKKVYIIIDALDEADKMKDQIIDLVNEYKGRIENKNAQFIFTSRIPDLGNLNSDYVQLGLSHITDEDIVELFDAMYERNKLTKQKASRDSSDLDIVNRETFIETLKNMSEDIKKNPLLMSNIIYIYFATREIEKQKSFIIEQSSNLLIDSLSDKGEIGSNVMENIDVGKLLEFIAFNASARDDDLNVAVSRYLSSLSDGKTYSNEMVDSICKYLRRKGIIIGRTLSHSIYSSYFASKYIYNRIYTIKIDYDFFQDEIEFVRDEQGRSVGREKLRNYIIHFFSKNNGLWPDITANFVVKLDYEIHHIYKEELVENSITYHTFNETMEEMITDPGIISNTAATIIKEICQSESALYYPELIAKYVN